MRANGESLAEAGDLDEGAAHVLVVDDDSRIRDLLCRFLSSHGFRVTAAGDAAAARRHLESFVFDLLVVDVMMPGESGVALTRSLRETLAVPVLMLTARSETEHRIDGLEAGADDYLAKPFDPRELLLRINSILRRSARHEPEDAFKIGDLVFHPARGELKRGEETVRLTERERELLRLLTAEPGETVPRFELVGEASDASERAVDVQINRLRRKIERDPSNPLLLQTVRGIGYRLIVG